jgi:hypothetical protein
MLVAILYRHWLELRFRVLAAALPLIVLCSVTAVVAVALAPEVPVIVVYAWGLSVAAVFAGLVFGGNGMQTGLEPAQRSVPFTLTLPAGRFTLAWTRLCTAASIAAALVLALMVAVAGALWAAGLNMPLQPMAASTLLGLAAAVALQAVFGLALPLAFERFSPAVLAIVPVAVVLAMGRTLDESFTGWAHVVRFLVSQPTRWDVVGLLVSSVALSLIVAVVVLRLRDF